MSYYNAFMQVASFFISIVAVLIATAALFVPLLIERNRNRRKLFLKGYEYKRLHREGNVGILLLRLTVCNPAYIAQTVHYIHFNPPDGYQIIKLLPEVDLTGGTCSYAIGSNNHFRVSTSDVVIPPFDIEPLHSRTFLIGIYPLKLPGDPCKFSEIQVEVRGKSNEVVAQVTVSLLNPVENH